MFNKKVGLIALLAAFSLGDLSAVTLTNYTVGDVLVCFRKSISGNDLVVDAGQASVFINGTNNQRFSITNYNGSQLALIGTNSTTWSALGYYDDSVSPLTAQWNLFISRGRANFYNKSTAWMAEPSGAQQLLMAAGEYLDYSAGRSRLISVSNPSTPVTRSLNRMTPPETVPTTRVAIAMITLLTRTGTPTSMAIGRAAWN